jgi:hypothetical protein
MISPADLTVITLYLEGFFFGKISVLCALTCTLAKEEVQSFKFLGLGIYTGIFALYLQCPLKESRTATIVFYVLCLLYVLSMASIVSDSLQHILDVSDNFIRNIIIMQMRIGALSPQIQNDSLSMIYRVSIVQTVANGSCDFIAQCILVRINLRVYHPFYSPKSSKIFRCWIVWGKDIRVVIIPSFLAIAYIGQ